MIAEAFGDGLDRDFHLSAVQRHQFADGLRRAGFRHKVRQQFRHKLVRHHHVIDLRATQTCDSFGVENMNVHLHLGSHVLHRYDGFHTSHIVGSRAIGRVGHDNDGARVLQPCAFQVVFSNEVTANEPQFKVVESAHLQFHRLFGLLVDEHHLPRLSDGAHVQRRHHAGSHVVPSTHNQVVLPVQFAPPLRFLNAPRNERRGDGRRKGREQHQTGEHQHDANGATGLRHRELVAVPDCRHRDDTPPDRVLSLTEHIVVVDVDLFVPGRLELIDHLQRDRRAVFHDHVAFRVAVRLTRLVTLAALDIRPRAINGERMHRLILITDQPRDDPHGADDHQNPLKGPSRREQRVHELGAIVPDDPRHPSNEVGTRFEIELVVLRLFSRR